MPRPTAPDETTITSVPRARSAAIWPQTQVIRAVSSSPMPEVRTPVPSLITTRFGAVWRTEVMGDRGREAFRSEPREAFRVRTKA